METLNDETMMVFFREVLKKAVENTVFEVNSTVMSRTRFAKDLKKQLKKNKFHIDIEDITYGVYNIESTKAVYRITLENGKIGMLKYDNSEKQFKYIE